MYAKEGEDYILISWLQSEMKVRTKQGSSLRV